MDYRELAYLYHTDHSKPPLATFAVGAARSDGRYATGFESSQLAAAFAVDVESLLEANQCGLLVYIGDKDIPPVHGGISAVSHIFRIGDHQACLVVETYQREGNA